MTSIHFHYHSDGACTFNRALQPVRFCHDELLEQGVKLSTGPDIGKSDWLVFYSLPGDINTLMQVLKLKRQGVKLCWSLDDDLAAIPEWNPAMIGEDGMAVWDVMARHADAVIVSTEQLANVTYDAIIKHRLVPIFTCPNLLDIKTFPDSPFDGASFAETTVKWPIRFVWTGSPTHKGDVAVMEDALIHLLDKHGPGVVSVVFAGSLPPPDLMRKYLHSGVMHGASVPFPQYRRMANGLEPDVWLAPLADIPFNLSKSHLRVMEGWALGSCVVASNVGEYNRIRHGYDGFLVSPDHWLNTLDALVLDHNLRAQVSADGRARARAECDWRVEANRKPWVDALRMISEL